MQEKVKVKVQRVEVDDEAVKPISISGFVHGVIPEPGFVVKVEGSHGIPIYVRDTDLEKARDLRQRKGKPVAIDADSWKGR
jgi:hypothetical protein